MLQGNLSIDEPESELKRKYVQGYLRMAEQVASANPDLLILPEAPSPIIYQFDRDYRETLSSLAQTLPAGIDFQQHQLSRGGGHAKVF